MEELLYTVIGIATCLPLGRWLISPTTEQLESTHQRAGLFTAFVGLALLGLTLAFGVPLEELQRIFDRLKTPIYDAAIVTETVAYCAQGALMMTDFIWNSLGHETSKNRKWLRLQGYILFISRLLCLPMLAAGIHYARLA